MKRNFEFDIDCKELMVINLYKRVVKQGDTVEFKFNIKYNKVPVDLTDYNIIIGCNVNNEKIIIESENIETDGNVVTFLDKERFITTEAGFCSIELTFIKNEEQLTTTNIILIIKQNVLNMSDELKPVTISILEELKNAVVDANTQLDKLNMYDIDELINIFSNIPDVSKINELITIVDNKADITHTHDQYLTESEIDNIISSINKAFIGLENVDNTSDLDKPVSTAVQNALDSKVDKVDGKTLTSNDLTNELKINYDNAYSHSTQSHAPSNAQKNSDITKSEIEDKLIGNIITHTHDQYLTESEIDNIISSINKAFIGLENVDNTSDLNKPISTATQTVLDNKVDKVDGKTLTSNDLTNMLKSNYDSAYNHSQEAHAPSNAQKNSDITKSEIEDKLIGNIITHTHDQYLTEHQDISGKADLEHIHGITDIDELSNSLNSKVDKIEGKELSDNNYSSEDKSKVSMIKNNGYGNKYLSDNGTYKTITEYDDTELRELIESKADEEHNHVMTDITDLSKISLGLGNVDNTSDLNKPISTAVQNALDSKVDKVSGKSLISDAEITRLALVDNYDDTSIKSSITNINSQLNTKANKSELFSGSYNDLTDKPIIPSLDEYAKTDDVNAGLSNKVDKTNILSAISSTPSDDKLLSEKAIYNALLNKPSIYDDSETEKYFHNISANEFVNMLTPAVNLGNTLECRLNTGQSTAPDTIIGWETLWHNVETTKEIMEAYKKVGFKAIRIPVTWYEHMDENGVIASEWLARVKTIVDWAIESGLIVIINAHHDTNEGNYINAVASDYETSKAHLINIWTQVGEYFADYDNRLVFASMNECLNLNLLHKWNGDAESFEVINKLNQVFVDTVRSQAWNRNRFLLVPTYGAQISPEITSAFIMPGDNVKDRLIVEVHAYCSTIDTIKSAQASLRMNLIARGFPVFLAEYGIKSSEETDETERLNLLQLQTKIFREMGVGVCIWDNGSGSYKLLNRETYEFYYPDIVNGIIKSSNKHDFVKIPYLDENYNIKDISNWKVGKLRSSDGEYDPSRTHYFTSDQRLIPRYSSYIVSMNDHSNDRLLVVHRDKNMKMIGEVETKTNGSTITISDDDRYIDFCYYNTSTTSTKEQFAEYINNGYLQINKAESATQNFEIIEQPLNEALIDLDKRIGNGSSVDLTEYAKTSDINTSLSNKVDKVDGKELSDNNYSNEDKTKVSKIVTNGDGSKYLSDDGTYKEIGYKIVALTQSQYDTLATKDENTIYLIKEV